MDAYGLPYVTNTTNSPDSLKTLILLHAVLPECKVEAPRSQHHTLRLRVRIHTPHAVENQARGPPEHQKIPTFELNNLLPRKLAIALVHIFLGDGCVCKL